MGNQKQLIMLSRVANNLFWMDRYMERSYGLLNLIRTNHNSTIDSGDYSSWNAILKTYMGIEEFKIYKSYSDSISIIDFMLFDLNNSNTLINMVTRAPEVYRSTFQENYGYLLINITYTSTIKKL